MARAAALLVVAEVAEGYVGRMLWTWGCAWVEYRSVCWGMGEGARMLLTTVRILALMHQCARTQIRRGQAEANHPFQDLKQAVMGLA